MDLIPCKRQHFQQFCQDGLPIGLCVVVSSKRSIMTEIFINWLNQFSKTTFSPPALLIFDRASSYLDLFYLLRRKNLQICRTSLFKKKKFGCVPSVIKTCKRHDGVCIMWLLGTRRCWKTIKFCLNAPKKKIGVFMCPIKRVTFLC